MFCGANGRYRFEMPHVASFQCRKRRDRSTLFGNGCSFFKIKRTLESSEDTDQPGHPPRMLRVNYVPLATHLVDGKGFGVQADLSHRWTHISFSRFSHALAPQYIMTQKKK